MEEKVDRIQKNQTKSLNNAIENAYSIITKDYLAKLEKYEIIIPSEEDLDIDIIQCAKFYKLTKLVFNSKESFLNKLTTIVNVVFSIKCSLATIIKSDGCKIEYYLGIISKNSRLNNDMDIKRRNANAAAFKGALNGNLIGSDLQEVAADKIEITNSRENNFISSVSGVVSLRDEEDKNIESYVQGIENLVDSLKGQKYKIVMIADPIDSTKIQTIKKGYEMLHTQLSEFAGYSITVNENDSISVSEARTVGISEGLTTGVSLTQSHTKSASNTVGMNVGVSAGIGIGFKGFGVNVGGNVGFNVSRTEGISDTSGKTDSYTSSRQSNLASTDSSQFSEGTGKSIQLNYQNRSIKTLLDTIDKNLERLDECESYGAFDCASYVIAESRETSLTVASNYNALMRGENSFVQSSHINSWNDKEKCKILAKYICSMVHPRFWQDEEAKIIVTPASIISGEELAIQVGLPKKSVTGVTVIPMASFGRNVLSSNDRSITLGNLYHMGNDEGINGNFQKVSIDIESLSMHTFITGSTGSGKSTAIYSILDKLIAKEVKNQRKHISFLVIEPAKGEYKDRFGSYPNVSVYGTNYKKTPLLRINPFSFPDDIHVLEHIDRLVDIFNVCWPMYAAMPAVLKDAIERAYIVAGWDLEKSENKYSKENEIVLFPSFADVLEQINIAMDESAYSSDSKGDYKGALCTRIKSLTNGLYGQIFTANELPNEELFDKNVIVDLSRTGSSETKSLIMGLLVMKLQEYRMSSAETVNSPLKHITVLEEAHNILKRTSTEQSAEGSNLIGKSVEMLANSIAEMRTYGEGFVIADQAPGLMDMSVIRNTNTKIILRLPDYEDRELVGRAAGLDDDQIIELSKQKTFVAAVYQNNWLEPVLCNIDTNFKDIKKYSYNNKDDFYFNEKDVEKVVKFTLLPLSDKPRYKKIYRYLIESACRLPISTKSKTDFIKLINENNKDRAQKYKSNVVSEIFKKNLTICEPETKKQTYDEWLEYFMINFSTDLVSLSQKEQSILAGLLAAKQVEISERIRMNSINKK